MRVCYHMPTMLWNTNQMISWCQRDGHLNKLCFGNMAKCLYITPRHWMWDSVSQKPYVDHYCTSVITETTSILQYTRVYSYCTMVHYGILIIQQFLNHSTQGQRGGTEGSNHVWLICPAATKHTNKMLTTVDLQRYVPILERRWGTLIRHLFRRTKKKTEKVKTSGSDERKLNLTLLHSFLST